MNPNPDTLVAALNGLTITHSAQSLVIFIQVEDRVYQCPWSHFQYCTLTPRPGSRGNGSSMSSPVLLCADVTKYDFENALNIMSSGKNPVEILNASLSVPTARWHSTLKLARLWNYVHLGKTAIYYLRGEGIQGHGPLEKILYHDGAPFGNGTWLAEGLEYFVRRPQALNEQEAMRLGMNFTDAIIDMRERLTDNNFDINSAIKAEFGDFFKDGF